MKYRTNPNIVYCEICGRHLLVAARPEWPGKPYIQEINEQAAYCWELIGEDGEMESMEKTLSAHYGITEEEVHIGLQAFLDQMEQRGYVTGEDT